MLRRTTTSLAALAALGAVAPAAAERKKAITIDPMKTKIQGLTESSITSVMKNLLPVKGSAVMYYDGTARGEQKTMDMYGEVAEKLEGWALTGAMDCSEYKKHCDRVGVKTTPHLRMYPKQPFPNYEYTGEMTADAISKAVTKMIPGDKITKLDSVEDFQKLSTTTSSKLKVVIFSKTLPNPPSMLKALSTDTVFLRTVSFYWVGSKKPDIYKAAGASDKKSVLMYRAGKPLWYQAKDKSHKAIYNWINTYSESGTGDVVMGVDGKEAEIEEMEIKIERLRELTGKSSKDLCFGQKSVCAVFLSDGPISEKEIDSMLAWESKYATSSERAIKFSWMWMDVSEESKFKEAFQAQEKKMAEREDRPLEQLVYPSLIMVKPPKRKREESTLSYVAMENKTPVTSASVEALVEKVQSGPMYVRAPLPNFVPRQKKDSKQPKKEEL